jgi:asparagine synthase (glutamine-hydrolysing)
MCGIAGLVNLRGERFDPLVVKAMGDVVAHRGPNDAGYVFLRAARPGRHGDSFWVECCDDAFRHQNEHLAPLGGEYARRELSTVTWDVAFAHRRLSILDLSHYGHQPMSNADRTLWMVYNGETYNFQELRDELASRGHHFRSRTDSEVVLHLYEEYGDDFLQRLDGMFALAIWDRRRNRLLCARDRFGVKPFYYHAGGGFFVFGSEIKSIFASGALRARVNPEALPEYFTFQNMASDQTLFEGVRSLPPGHVLTLELAQPDSGPRLRRYWGFDFSRMRTPAELPEARCTEELAGLAEAAVRRQLVSDVTVGSYLSGGMDSGSIVGFASHQIPRLYTFTAGFDLSSVTGIESGFDERGKAEQLASRYQTEHYEVVIHAGDMAACLPRLVWHLEDLRVGNCYQNFYAAKLASRFVRVCLAGAGGDELFGGYPWRYKAAAQADTTAAFDDVYYRFWERLVPDASKHEVLSSELLAGVSRRSGRPYFDELLAAMPAPRFAPGQPRFSANLTRALWFELNTFLPGILCVEDRVSMSHSLEVRVPFLDNALVDYALTIPNEYKVSGLDSPEERPFDTSAGKQILRKAMSRVLPPETVAERKQGFSPPDDNWYRGPNMNYIQEILLDPLTLGRGFFAPGAIERVIAEHSAGRVNHRLLIWSLLCFEWLQRVLVDQPSYRVGGAEA